MFFFQYIYEQIHRYNIMNIRSTTDFRKGKSAVARQQRDSDPAGGNGGFSQAVNFPRIAQHHPWSFGFILLDKEPCQYCIQLS